MANKISSKLQEFLVSLELKVYTLKQIRSKGTDYVVFRCFWNEAENGSKRFQLQIRPEIRWLVNLAKICLQKTSFTGNVLLATNISTLQYYCPYRNFLFMILFHFNSQTISIY